ncbi:MAG: hypothetical protein V9E83_03615 [Baekduia sp.]
MSKATRDGKVVDRAFLANVGGGEVDEEAAVAGGVSGVGEGGADAFEGFFHAGVGQADDECRGCRWTVLSKSTSTSQGRASMPERR